jgi:hypothetical protein
MGVGRKNGACFINTGFWSVLAWDWLSHGCIAVALLVAPACEREFFFLTQPTFDCRIWQHGVEWHWQITNDLEQVFASGVAESNLAARSAAILQCLRSMGMYSGGPN